MLNSFKVFSFDQIFILYFRKVLTIVDIYTYCFLLLCYRTDQLLNLCSNTFSFSDYVFIPSGHKNKLLMLGGFTFAQNHTKRLWYCSQKRNGCKAKVRMNEDDQIVYADNNHSHQPPEYHVTNTGQFILLRSYRK